MAEWYSFFVQFSKHFTTVVLFLLLILNDQPESIVLVYLSSLIINGILSFFILNKTLGKLPKTESFIAKLDYSLISILKTSKEFFFASIIVITMVWIDFILIDMFFDETTAGVYSIALKLSTLISFGFTAFNAFLAPRISEIYFEGNPQKLQRLLSQNFVLIFPTLLFPFLGILFFNQQLLSFFGSEFKSGWVILLLLTAGQFINSLFGPVSLLLQMTNYQKIFQNILLFVFAFKLISALVFVKIWGAEGIAFASFLGLSLWTCIGSYFVYKKLGIYSWFSLKEIKSIYFNG